LTDDRYCREEIFTPKPADCVELLVTTQKDYQQPKAVAEQPPLEGPIADNLSPTELMEQKLLTGRGRRWYEIGGQTVAPVFRQIKANAVNCLHQFPTGQ